MESVVQLALIRTSVKAKCKEDVLKIVTDIAYENNIIKSKEIYYQGLLQRESECTTGFGKGFAIPHCKSTTVNTASVIICKLNNLVEWESMDDKPVNFVLALAVPESEAGTTHLKILSQIARMLMDDEFTDRLKNTNTSNDIYSLMSEKLKGGQ